MESKYNWFALEVISSGTWCPVKFHCDRATSLCEEYHQLLSGKLKLMMNVMYVRSNKQLNTCCGIVVM